MGHALGLSRLSWIGRVGTRSRRIGTGGGRVGTSRKGLVSQQAKLRKWKFGVKLMHKGAITSWMTMSADSSCGAWFVSNLFA